METPLNPRLSHRSASIDVLPEPYSLQQNFNCYTPDKDDPANLHAVPRRLLQNNVPLRRQSETPAEAVLRRKLRRAVVSTPLLGLELDNKLNGFSTEENDNYFNASYQKSGLKKLKSGSWESIVRWEKENELLFAFIEDECEWLSELFPEERIDPDHFFQKLQDGVVLVKLAKLCQDYAESYGKMNNLKIPFFTVHIHSHEKCSGRMGNFLSRENVELFLKWCRAHKIHESLLFESNDVVEKTEKEGLRDGAREIVLCLMEVARYGVRFGVKAPKLILLEKEIEFEEEMENSIDGSISPKSGDSGVDTELDHFNLSYLGDVSFSESRNNNSEKLENIKNNYKNSQKTENVNSNGVTNGYTDIKDLKENRVEDTLGLYCQNFVNSPVNKRFSDIQETRGENGSDDMLDECGLHTDVTDNNRGSNRNENEDENENKNVDIDGAFEDDNANTDFSPNDSNISDSSSICKHERKRRSYSGRKFSQENVSSNQSQGKGDNDKLRRKSSVNLSKSELHKIVTSIVETYNIQKITRVKEGKYIILGKVMFVRLLNKHCIVRIGGGWDTLEHYLMTHVNKVAAGSLEIEANPYSPTLLQSKRSRKKAQYSSTPNLLSSELSNSGRCSPAFDRSISPHISKDPYLQQKVKKQQDDKLITEAISRVQADIIANHPRPTSALEKIHIEVRKRESPVPYNWHNMADVEAVPFDHNANLVKDEDDVQNTQFDCERSDESKDTEDGVHINGEELNGVLVNGIHENGIHENGVAENGLNGECHANNNGHEQEQKVASENGEDEGIIETTTVTEVTNIIIPADETGDTVSEISSSKVVSSTKKTKKLAGSKSASTLKPKEKSLNPSSKSSSSLVNKKAPGATKTSTTRTVTKSVTPTKTTIKKTTTTTTKTNAPTTAASKPTATKPASTRPTSARPTTAKPTSARPISSRPTTTKPASATAKPGDVKKTTATKTAATRPTTAKSAVGTKPTTDKASSTKTALAKTTATKPTPPKTTVSKPLSTKPSSAKPSPKASESKTTIEKKTASTSSKVIKSKDTKVTEVKKTTSETKMKSVKTSETSAVKKTKPVSTISRPSTAKTATKTTPDVEKSKAKPASAGLKSKTTATKTTRPATAGTRPATAPSASTAKKTATKTKTDGKTKPVKKVTKKEEPVVLPADVKPTDVKVDAPVITPTDEKADLVINLCLEESTPESVSPFSPHSDVSETNLNTSSTIESIETTVEMVHVESSLHTHEDDELITNDANEEHFQPSESVRNESSEHDKSYEVIDDSVSHVQLDLDKLQLEDASKTEQEGNSVVPFHEDERIDSNEFDKLSNAEVDIHQPEVESNFEMIEHHDVEESNYLKESKDQEIESDSFVPLTAVSQYADLQSLETTEHHDDDNKDFKISSDNDYSGNDVEPSFQPDDKVIPTETLHDDEHSLQALSTSNDDVVEASKIEEATDSYNEDVQQNYDNEQQNSNVYLSREAELFCVTPLDRGLESDDAVTPFENSSPESSPAKSPFTSLDLTQDKNERIYDVETPMSDVAVCGTDEGSDQVLSSMEELSQEEDNKSSFHYDEPHEHTDYQSMNPEKEIDNFEKDREEGHIDKSDDYNRLDDEKQDQGYQDQGVNDDIQSLSESDHQNTDLQSDQLLESNKDEGALDAGNKEEAHDDDKQYSADFQQNGEDYRSPTEDHQPCMPEDNQPNTGDYQQPSNNSQQYSEYSQGYTEDLHQHSEESRQFDDGQQHYEEQQQQPEDIAEKNFGHENHEENKDDSQTQNHGCDENHVENKYDSETQNHGYDENHTENKDDSLTQNHGYDENHAENKDDSQTQNQGYGENHAENKDDSQTQNQGYDENHAENKDDSLTQNQGYGDNVIDDMEEIGINRSNEMETDDNKEQFEVKSVWGNDGAEVSGATEESQHSMENDQTSHETSENNGQLHDQSSEHTSESNGILFMKRLNGSDKESSDESEDPSSPNHHIMVNQSKVSMTTTTYGDYEGMHLETEGSWQSVEVTTSTHTIESNNFYDNFASDQHALTNAENLG